MVSQMKPLQFPASLGASTVHTISPGVAVRIFLVDATMPLYNVVYGSLKFLANREQTQQQIEALSLDGAKMPAPNWTWSLDAGFDKSVDGHAKKGWVVQYDCSRTPTELPQG